jgi:hypothetical protein
MSLRDDMAEAFREEHESYYPDLPDVAVAVVGEWLGSDEAREALIKIQRTNAINCTGPGEVGCNGQHGWHTWTEHREHVAEAQVDALRALARGEG